MTLSPAKFFKLGGTVLQVPKGSLRHFCHYSSVLIVGFLLLMGTAACHRKRVAVQLPTGTVAAGTLPEDERVGIASWYGDPYHGRRTSNGEIYNKYALTAAHRTLAFDTLVKVNNLENGKSVKVRINDRGPFVKDRIIDLSYAAAQEIRMVGPGSARVRLDILETQANPYPLTIQAGAFRQEQNATDLRNRLLERFNSVSIREYQSVDGVLYRVYAGEYTSYEQASIALRDLKKQGIEGFIVRLDH
ncbi:MAG TPA: septal ring lytic transglycosylase RlpA family protein [Terriglobia bacterium]|nr:septal ring lytic transglycosylase RlpA family protein [Terriglobia bacterium]